MKKPKVIRFRCYCIECSDDEKPKDSTSQSAAAESERDDINKNEPNPLLIADSVESVLFGA